MGCKKQGAKKQCHCYLKREEAAWQTMFRCSFCVFLIILLLYTSIELDYHGILVVLVRKAWLATNIVIRISYGHEILDSCQLTSCNQNSSRIGYHMITEFMWNSSKISLKAQLTSNISIRIFDGYGILRESPEFWNQRCTYPSDQMGTELFWNSSWILIWILCLSVHVESIL